MVKWAVLKIRQSVPSHNMVYLFASIILNMHLHELVRVDTRDLLSILYCTDATRARGCPPSRK